jgi:hypothetical protein
MHTLKEECLWLKEWSYPSKLIKALEDWITSDNEHSLHSALGDKTPRHFERAYDHSHSPPFVAA